MPCQEQASPCLLSFGCRDLTASIRPREKWRRHSMAATDPSGGPPAGAPPTPSWRARLRRIQHHTASINEATLCSSNQSAHCCIILCRSGRCAVRLYARPFASRTACAS